MKSAASITLDRVTYAYGATPAVENVELAIRSGELVTLVGPSGCGKSTILRVIAGLLTPNDGRLLLDGTDVQHVPPEQRHIGWMPQSYALFDHLNVTENVAFGLKMQGTARQEKESRVREVLELCRISQLASRPVSALSGGQRQRVAVARALAVRPRVLLLDEPLAALDPQLRLEVRSGLKRLLRKSGVTTLFVTHDQDEAVALADRVAVLKDGRLEQFGTPEVLWHQPTSAFVASFLGNASVISTRRLSEDEVELLPGLTVPLAGAESPTVALRASDLKVTTDGTPLMVADIEYAGGTYRILGRHDNGTMLHFYCDTQPQLGEVMRVNLRQERTLTVVGHRG